MGKELKEEELRREAKEILAGGKSSLSSTKKVFYDQKAKQFSIKIPKDVASGALLSPGSEVQMIVNPTTQELEEIQKSHFIIYGKEKEQSN